MFTAVNIIKKWVLAHRVWIVSPENRGNQYENAAKIAKIAPILST